MPNKGMNNLETPHNALPLYDSEGNLLDDSGKRVVINSVGGPSWPDNRSGKAVINNYEKMIKQWTKEDNEVRRKRSMENMGGTVVWGPCDIEFFAMAKSGKFKDKAKKQPLLKRTKFVSGPWWGVLLDTASGNHVLSISREELTFVD